jgi:hypothetical protein
LARGRVVVGPSEHADKRIKVNIGNNLRGRFTLKPEMVIEFCGLSYYSWIYGDGIEDLECAIYKYIIRNKVSTSYCVLMMSN